ncbi:collagen alpha-2(IX) chain-like [Rhipicephalus sanguineus]|uniref:collagen alpha-2(IX) chain-like n=1 Tax=Rhipicephalus sanguineus TaxID=34632 RepID=UPI0018931981|nr:collagen alpha-2(IX) chain-like [Rhipicephalus sanguineus]
MKLLTGKLVLLCVSFTQFLLLRVNAQSNKGIYERLPKQCLKDPFIGVCRPLMTTAWYFDTQRHTCVSLPPGVCAGGNNLFPTFQKCMEECQLLTQKKSKVCLWPPTVGPCGPVVVSWYYDAGIDRCKAFNRTICGGGGNCYVTELKCQFDCRPSVKPEARCSQPPEPGRCFIAQKRYFFNDKTNECVPFPNNKCGKNRNAFRTLKRCKARCSYNKAASQISNQLPTGGVPGQAITPSNLGPFGQPGYPLPQGQPALPNTIGSPSSPTLPGQPNQPIHQGQVPPGPPPIPGHSAPPNMLGQPTIPGQPTVTGQLNTPGHPAIPGQTGAPGFPNAPLNPGVSAHPSMPGQVMKTGASGLHGQTPAQGSPNIHLGPTQPPLQNVPPPHSRIPSPAGLSPKPFDLSDGLPRQNKRLR